MDDSDKIRIEFAKRVRLMRAKKSVSQEDLAALMNTDTRQIGRIENAEVFVNLKTVYRIAKALNISHKELFDFEL